MYYKIPREFSRVFMVQFEGLSQTYISKSPIYHTGYPPAIDSYDSVS